VIRRLSAAFAAVALTSTVAAGCSTFTKNDNAAKVGGTALTVSQFEAISKDLFNISAPSTGSTVAGGTTTTIAPKATYTGDDARSLLTRWIYAQMLSAALATSGTPISADSKAAAEASLKSSAAEQWTTLDTATQDFLVTELAGQNTLVTGSIIPDADVKAAYEKGLSTSNTLCLRVIAFSDATKANDVYDELIKGADFATTADANNADPTAGKGGVYTDAQTKSECVSANALNSQVAQTLLQTPIGTAAAPAAFSASDGSKQYFIFYQRPWAEVTDAAAPLVRRAVGPSVERKLLAGAKATIDSRYGEWNSAELKVVPTS
jgi:hypothetical protein